MLQLYLGGAAGQGGEAGSSSEEFELCIREEAPASVHH